jgi:predicted secreted hydrolase
LKKLNKIEKELEKVRGASPLSDGWQTQRLAKKQRKWDELAKEKINILIKINEYESKS